MKKKLVLVTVCLALALCFVFAACKVTPEQLVLDQLFEASKNAKEINANITVRKGAEVVATELVKYDISAGTKTTKKSVPNTDFTSDEAWKETTTTGKIGPNGVQFEWKVENFSELTLDNLTLKGTLGADALQTNLGVSASEVNGDVSVAITITGSIAEKAIEISKVEISYTAQSGNKVSIVVTMK